EGEHTERTSIVLDHLRVVVLLSDSTTLDIGETRNEFRLAKTNEGWRITRWIESHAAPASADSLGERLARAAGPLSGSAVVPPSAQLALTARQDRGRAAIVFDLVLPARGGALELFDVMGRRVMQQDLDDLPPGRHTVAYDGAKYPVGIYWARLRQGGT